MARQGRPKPEFKNGTCVIVDYGKRALELSKRAWNHIIGEKNRVYFERSFDKIAQTLKKPDEARKSIKQKNVVIYERHFTDLYLNDNTVLGRMYINVVVNQKTKRILTAYPSLKKRRKGTIVWPRKKG